MDDKQELSMDEVEYKKADDLRNELGMAPSTIRKYALLLENAGYTFRKGSRNARFFNEKDQFLIFKMAKLIKETGMDADKAAAFVMNGHSLEEPATDLISSVAVPEQDSQNDNMAPLVEKVLNELFYLRKHTVSEEEFKNLSMLTSRVLDEVVEMKAKQKEKDEEIALLKEKNAFIEEKFERVLNMIERQERESSKKKGFLSKFFGS